MGLSDHQFIFVNGHARAGTTWFAELLRLYSDADYLFEPFSSGSTVFSGIDAQTIIKKVRQVQYGKRGAFRWELLSDQLFLTGDSEYAQRFVPLLEQHLLALPEMAQPGVKLLKQPRIESHHLFRDLLGENARFVFIERDPMGVIDSHAYGVGWSWVEEDWQAFCLGEGRELVDDALAKQVARKPWRKLYFLVRQRKQFVAELVEEGEAMVVDYETLCRSPDELFSVAEALGLRADEAGASLIREKYKAAASEDWEIISTDRKTSEQSEQWKHRLPHFIVRDLANWDFCAQHESLEGVKGDRRLSTFVKSKVQLALHQRRLRKE